MNALLLKMTDTELSELHKDFSEVLAQMPVDTPLDVKMNVRFAAFYWKLEMDLRSRKQNPAPPASGSETAP